MRVAPIAHVRRHAVAYLALFIALGGTAVAAATLPRNSVGTRQIRDGQVKNADLGGNAVSSGNVANGSLLARDFVPGELPRGARGPQGPQGPQGPAGPNNDSRYVNEGQVDSIGPAMELDRTRAVSIPLTSFVTCPGSAAPVGPIDFSSGADRAPDFTSVGNNQGDGYALAFDATAPNRDEDFMVCGSLSVPQDYVSGATVRLHTTQNVTPTAPAERVLCRLAPNPGTDQVTIAGSPTLCAPPGVLNRGQTVTVGFMIVAPGDMNDAVVIRSVQFQYLADG